MATYCSTYGDETMWRATGCQSTRALAYAAREQERPFLPPATRNPLAPTSDPVFPTELLPSDWDAAVVANRFSTLSPSAHDASQSIVPTICPRLARANRRLHAQPGGLSRRLAAGARETAVRHMDRPLPGARRARACATRRRSPRELDQERAWLTTSGRGCSRSWLRRHVIADQMSSTQPCKRLHSCRPAHANSSRRPALLHTERHATGADWPPLAASCSRSVVLGREQALLQLERAQLLEH